MYCRKCGAERVNGADFCPMCGYELPKLVYPTRFEDGVVLFSVEGTDIIIQPENSEMFELTWEFSENFVELYNSLTDYLSHWGSYFDSVYEKALPFFFKTLIRMMDFFYGWLLDNGINYITSKNDFVEEMINILDIEGDMEIFVTWADAVTEAVDQINAVRAAQRGSRSRWQGGGFGIKGAVKGAISAGIMNFGTDILRSIGDSHVDKKDAETIKKIKRTTGQLINPKMYLQQLFVKYYIRIMQFVLEFYVYDRCDGDTDYMKKCARMRQGISLAEELRPSLLNEPDSIPKYKKVVGEAISIYPFDPNSYVHLIETVGCEPQQIEVLVSDVGIVPFFEAQVLLNVSFYIFKLEVHFSNLTNLEKLDYWQRIWRLSFCSCLHENAGYVRKMYYQFSEKLKKIGLIK